MYFCAVPALTVMAPIGVLFLENGVGVLLGFWITLPKGEKALGVRGRARMVMGWGG